MFSAPAYLNSNCKRERSPRRDDFACGIRAETLGPHPLLGLVLKLLEKATVMVDVVEPEFERRLLVTIDMIPFVHDTYNRRKLGKP